MSVKKLGCYKNVVVKKLLVPRAWGPHSDNSGAWCNLLETRFALRPARPSRQSQRTS
jgi:hypothetical protein